MVRLPELGVLGWMRRSWENLGGTHDAKAKWRGRCHASVKGDDGDLKGVRGRQGFCDDFGLAYVRRSLAKIGYAYPSMED